jgi:hypothetical protein
MALELLEQLIDQRAGTPEAPELTRLHGEIAADRQTLEALMAELGITTNVPQQASAWLTEKLSELKLRLDDPSGQTLWRLESLEALTLGLAGKKALWQSLVVAAESAPDLGGRDYAHLIKCAEEQFEIAERLRLEAARDALGRSG